MRPADEEATYKRGSGMTKPLIDRDPVVRHRWAEELLERLDGPMGALGVLFALLVLVETVSQPTGPAATAVIVTSWVLWAIFAAEFAARVVVAPSTSAFLRKNWWQVLFLVLPFVRFLRFLRAVRRTSRLGRVVSSVVRSGRGAARRLTSRIGWLAIGTASVIVGGSQVVFELGGAATYGDALYLVALAAVVGEPMGQPGVMKFLDVVFAIFSVVVFATLAGSIGSFILERGREGDSRAAYGTE